MAFSLRTKAHSEIGLVRKNNQDSGYFSPTMLLVADGMGGAAAGDLASTVAVNWFKKADQRLEGEEMIETTAGALSKANDQLADLVAWNNRLEGMGTTVTGAMFSGTEFGLIHIGDSRAYLFRDNKLIRLTKDHSWVQSLVDEGKITEEEAESHPHRSLLLKVLNGQPNHAPDAKLFEAKLGDRLLLCSDGLSGHVSDAKISRALADLSLDTVLKELVQAAHAGGGSDNITIVISDVVEQDDELDALPPTVVGAATNVTIPRISTFAINLGDGDDDKKTNHIPLAPAPSLGANIPEGVIDPDANEEVRYTPTIRAKRRIWPLLLTLVLTSGLFVGSFFGGRAYLSTQFFIGPEDDSVAIYRGLPDRPLGISLSRIEETTTIRIDDLPPYYAKAVRRYTLRPKGLEAARSTTAELARKAQICVEQRAQHKNNPSSSPTQGNPPPDPTPPQPTTTMTSATPTPTANVDPSDREACS